MKVKKSGTSLSIRSLPLVWGLLLGCSSEVATPAENVGADSEALAPARAAAGEAITAEQATSALRAAVTVAHDEGEPSLAELLEQIPSVDGVERQALIMAYLSEANELAPGERRRAVEKLANLWKKN
jgi:hypothetical protein